MRVMYAHGNNSMNPHNNKYEPVEIVTRIAKKFAWKLLHFDVRLTKHNIRAK